jgi:hypothetical protein
MARSYNKSSYGSDSGDDPDVFSSVSLRDRTTPGADLGFYGGDLATRPAQQAGPNPFLQGFERTGLWGMQNDPVQAAFREQEPGEAPEEAIGRKMLEGNVRDAAQAYRDLSFQTPGPQRDASMQRYRQAIAAKNAPAQAPDSEERYNKFLVRRGINPRTIGTATLNDQGGLDVVSPSEEEATMKTRDKANQLASMCHRAQMFYGDRRKRFNLKGEELPSNYNPEKALQAYQATEGVRGQGGLGSYEGSMQAALRNQGLIPNPFTQPRRNLYRPEEEEQQGTANGYRS